MGGMRWKVVGGVEQGGIIVRVDESLASAKASSRLAVGAIVEGLQVNGHRLRFRKLVGTGPDDGWVSIRYGSMVLMEPLETTSGSSNDGCLLAWFHGSHVTTLLQCLRMSWQRIWHTQEARNSSCSWKAAGFVFFSSFDSGNCACVTLSDAGAGVERSRSEDEEHVLCFRVQVRKDNQGTPFEKDECQWFHFGMRGCMQPGQRLRFQILGLSRFRQVDGIRTTWRLLTDGLRPVFCTGTCTNDWRFVSGECGLMHMQDGTIAFCFEHIVTLKEQAAQELYFAACFPYPLSRITDHLQQFQRCREAVYINNERLAYSLGGRPIELLTITHASNASDRRQPPLQGLQTEGERPLIFEGRRAIFISARVHPGETPASFMLQGLLDFLVSGNPVAKVLLARYVFHVVPVLNPDGVELGHHRLDTRGVNLNRVYGEASLEEHPSIYAAMLACFSAHEHQGGLRLYLDLHAHSNRRGAFLLGDAGEDCAHHVASKLYAYALGRRCNLLEYDQCSFQPIAVGTGKSAIASRTGVSLCFTVESNYCRGHHSADPFVPSDWMRLGANLLLALHDMDSLQDASSHEAFKDPSLQLQDISIADIMRAEDWLTAEFEGIQLESLDAGRPGRACPEFAEVIPDFEHQSSQTVLLHPELIGCCVEVIETRGSRRRLHECDGGYWIGERDLRPRDRQSGRFFYGVLCDVPLTRDADPQSSEICVLPAGAVLEAEERCVINGTLRVKVIADTHGGRRDGGWASEYKRIAFDPRLGGVVQLMRLSGPPRSRGAWKGLHHYTFGA